MSPVWQRDTRPISPWTYSCQQRHLSRFPKTPTCQLCRNDDPGTTLLPPPTHTQQQQRPPSSLCKRHQKPPFIKAANVYHWLLGEKGRGNSHPQVQCSSWWWWHIRKFFSGHEIEDFFLLPFSGIFSPKFPTLAWRLWWPGDPCLTCGGGSVN